MDKTLKRLIRIHFQTKIKQGDHVESYEFSTEGELYDKGDQYYLRFKEVLSETETVQTTMKWNGTELMLIRQGAILMRQAFVAQKTTYGRYVTPEISWETTAVTDELAVKWPTQNEQGLIDLSYQFALQGQNAGSHRVVLTLEEEKNK